MEKSKHLSDSLSTADIYDFKSPLWDNYFQRTRKNVRFPRNYKEVSALDCDGCGCEDE